MASDFSSSNPKLALSARLLKHAHAPVFRSTVFPVLAELKQDLIDAAAELERQRREVEHLTQMLGRPSDETVARQSDVTIVKPLDLEQARRDVAPVIAEERQSERWPLIECGCCRDPSCNQCWGTHRCKRHAVKADCDREGHEWRKGSCAICGIAQGNL